MDQVEEVKSKVDIVEIISSHIPLKKMGRNFGGLCPFHGEKTPSFMVSPERQTFKCFGCGEGGDVLTFLEKIEGWDFREALEELAKRAGVKLKDHMPTKGSKVREKLIEINTITSKFYKHMLFEHKLGEVARNYLLGRGIDKKLWEIFELGYSPEGWENTYNFLKKHGFTDSEVAVSGLVIARESRGASSKTGFYDRFRGRIMFPIKDGRGTILGFSGRVINASKDQGIKESRVEAKYINGPETPIFTKGTLLFGLNAAKESIREKNEAVLVEGEFDVISAHIAGVTNTVASKGTALTEKQVALISRLCENVALCFDMDLAGDAAARRGIELLDIAGLNVKVVRLEGGKDADEVAQKSPKSFQQAVERALNVYDYLIDSAVSRFDANSSEGKKKIGREVLPVISKISDDLVRGHYVTRLAKELSLDVAIISEAISQKRSDLKLVDDDPVQAAAHGMDVLDAYFMALFFAGDKVLSTVCDKVEPHDFETSEISLLWEVIRDIINVLKDKSVGKVVEKIPSQYSKLIDHFYFVNISPAVLEKEAWADEINKAAARIKKRSYTKQLSDLSQELKKYEKENNSDKIGDLTEKFEQISSKLMIEESNLI